MYYKLYERRKINIQFFNKEIFISLCLFFLKFIERYNIIKQVKIQFHLVYFTLNNRRMRSDVG